jgi:ubiquinone/menaquinone biosynthesis C-methylase UbiE
MDPEQRKIFIQKTFDTVAGGYDNRPLRFFSLNAGEMVRRFGLAGGEHILDVATGTGEVALAFAAALPAGRVTGVDFSEGMLARAGEKARQAGLTNTAFCRMDMQDLQFPDGYFDGATCAFGIFFVDEMEETLAHIARKVRAGGRVMIAGFHETAFHPMTEMLLGRLERYGVPIPPQNWRRISTEEKCEALFRSAGLGDIRVERLNVGYLLENAQIWWEIVWNAGWRGLVTQLAPEDFTRFKQEHLAEVAALATGEGIRLDVEVLQASGRSGEIRRDQLL